MSRSLREQAALREQAPRWQAAGMCATGARHLDSATPCQDAVRVYQSDDMVIAAVADGHGDPKYARSEDGARIAVEVTAALFRELGEALLQMEDTTPPLQIEQSLKVHLPRRLVWEWNRKVRAHAGHSDIDGTWHRDLTLYGTTILAALFTRRLGLFLQLGDGDILLVEPGHTRCVFPLHDDIYGPLTHSLCQPGAADYARVRCLSLSSPRLATLTSDGVSDSLQGDPEAFLSIGPWLEALVAREGWERAIESLPAWLAALSRQGNGDDTTIALVHWSPPTR